MRYFVTITRSDNGPVEFKNVVSSLRRSMRVIGKRPDGYFYGGSRFVNFVTRNEDSAVEVYSKAKRTFDMSMYNVFMYPR